MCSSLQRPSTNIGHQLGADGSSEANITATRLRYVSCTFYLGNHFMVILTTINGNY